MYIGEDLGNVTIQTRTELSCWDGIPPIRELAPQLGRLGARAEDNTIPKDIYRYIRHDSTQSMILYPVRTELRSSAVDV